MVSNEETSEELCQERLVLVIARDGPGLLVVRRRPRSRRQKIASSKRSEDVLQLNTGLGIDWPFSSRSTSRTHASKTGWTWRREQSSRAAATASPAATRRSSRGRCTKSWEELRALTRYAFGGELRSASPRSRAHPRGREPVRLRPSQEP